jgi:pyrimidine operon attenuation protein/uracil phosphoribosyltransferase
VNSTGYLPNLTAEVALMREMLRLHDNKRTKRQEAEIYRDVNEERVVLYDQYIIQ